MTAVLVSAALAAFPLDLFAAKGAKAALAGLLARAEGFLGVAVSYDRASPSVFGGLRVFSLSLTDSEPSNVLHADRLEAEYDVASAVSSLLSGSGAGGSLERIILRNVDIDLDLQRHAELLERIRNALRSGSGGSGTMGRVELSARRVRMNLRDPARGTSVLAEIRSLDLFLSDREIVVVLDGTLSGSVRDPRSPFSKVSLSLGIRGSTNRDFSAARFNVALAARSDAGILERQEFSVLLRDGIWEARKVRDNAPFDLYARYDTRTGALETDFHFESLLLSRIGRPTGNLQKTWAPWFRRPYSGHVNLQYGGAGKSPRLVADVSGFLPPGFLGDDFSFRISAEGGTEGIRLRTLELRSPYGEARATGAFRPDLTSVDISADIDYRARNGKIPLRTRIELLGEGRELFLTSPSTELGGVRFNRFTVSAERSSGTLDFRGNLELPGPEGGTTEPGGKASSPGTEAPRLSWEGSMLTGAKPFLETSILIDPLSLAALEPLLVSILEPSAASLLSSLSVSGRVSLSTDFSRFSYSASDFRVSPSGPAGEATFAVLNLSGTAEELSVTRFSASLRGVPVEGRLTAEIGPSRLGFRSELTLRDIPYSVQGDFEDRRLILTGDYGFSLVATLLEPGARGFLSFKSFPVPLRDGVVLATGDATGEFRSVREWNLRIPSLALDPDSGLKGRLPPLRLAGAGGPGGGEFPDVSVGEGAARLSGSASYSVEGDPAGTLRGELRLAGGKGEGIRAIARYGNGTVEGRVDLQNFSPAGLFGGPVAGGIDGSVSVSGTLADPRAEFSLALRDGSFRGRSFSLAAEGSADRRGLEVRDGSGRFGIHQAQSVRGRVGFETGILEVGGAYAGFLAGAVARFRFDVQGTLNAVPKGSGGFPELSRIADTLKLQGRIRDFSMGQNRADTWPFTLERNGRDLVFQGGADSEVQVRILDDGSFLARAAPPFPLSALVVGKVADRQISMDLSDIRLEMTTLWPIIPVPEVRFLSGIATGSLSVRGTSADPEIFGSLRFQDAILEVPNYVNGAIGPVTAPLEANGRMVTLVQQTVDVGPTAKAGVSLSFEMSQWIPRSFSLRARSLESTQVPLKTRFLGMNITGTADADIFLAASDGQFSLSGALTIPRAEIVIDPSIMQAGAAGDGRVPTVDTRIDLAVRIGKGVTVYFPSKEFPVIIGQADPSSRLTVSYDDSQQSYALKGNAVLRGGNLFYIQRNFFLKNGRMVFNENQYTFDPRVTLEAELRTRRGDETVKILLKAENASLLNFQPTLESTPSLSQTEIAALLGSDLVASADGSDVDIRRTLIASTDILPQLNFITVFERNTRQLLGLDLFYLRTELVQRWLLDVARLDDTSGGGVTLADYLDNTSIFAGKYIRDDVFVRGALRLQQDQPLVNRSSLRLDSEIGFELTTPFFLFDWSLSFLHPEDLFISDNSFRFTWKLTY